MLASLLNNQTVVVGAAAPPPVAGVIRREVGRFMITVNTAFNREVDLVDADGLPVTGATLTVTLSKDGGAFAAITPTVTERGNGAYNLALTSVHNNTVGSHVKYVTATGGAVPQFVYDQVVVEPATQAALTVVDDLLDTEVAAITTAVGLVKAKTDTLPTDPADQSLIIAATDAVMSRLGAPAGASLAADIAAGGGGGGLTGPQAAQLTAIEGKTAPLPTDPADQSLLMAAIASVGGGAAPSAAENATAVWAKVIEAQGSITAQQALDAILAIAAGATGDTGLTFKTPNGSAVRVVATVNALNERTTITLTPSAP